MTAPAFTLVEGGRETTVPASAVDALIVAGDRPLAVDGDERVAYVGESARARAGRLASLEAPDFSLPDLDGRRHALAEQRGRKVLLVAYASW